MKKHVISFILVISLLFSLPVFSVSAETLVASSVVTEDGSTIIYYDDGSTLVISPIRTTNSPVSKATTGTRAVTNAEVDATYTASDGTLEWKYTLYATFSYTYGVSATCTSASYTQNIYQGNWAFSDGVATRSGATANGKGVYKQSVLFIVVRTANVDLYMTCDKYGVVS